MSPATQGEKHKFRRLSPEYCVRVGLNYVLILFILSCRVTVCIDCIKTLKSYTNIEAIPITKSNEC